MKIDFIKTEEDNEIESVVTFIASPENKDTPEVAKTGFFKKDVLKSLNESQRIPLKTE